MSSTTRAVPMFPPPPAPAPPGNPYRSPEHTTVTINFKRAFGEPGTSEEIVWPKNWPLPQQGDQITVGELTGIVVNLHFRPAEHKLVVQTR